MTRSSSPALVLALGVLVIAIGLSVYWALVYNPSRTPAGQIASPTAGIRSSAAPAAAPLRYNPPGPDSAPQDIRDAVLLGNSILMDTQKTLPDYVGNQLNCSNCHFLAGVTQGGKNGGISLVGVAATYPKYRDRQKFAVDLVARVND